MKHKSNFPHVIFAFCVLLFAACQTEIGTSQETKTCVVGPNNLGGNVTNTTDDAGRYAINWAAVPNAVGYTITTINESDSSRFVAFNTTPFGVMVFEPPPKTYTCDSFLFRVQPMLSSGTLCIPQGQDVRLSRVRGGITAVIINRTTGGSCSTNTSLKQFNDSSFVIGRTPMTNAFADGTSTLQGFQRTFNNKILNNADSAGYLKIIVKNCAGAVTNTRTQFVTKNQTGGFLSGLKNRIIAAADSAGIQNAATNTNAFIENIRFEK